MNVNVQVHGEEFIVVLVCHQILLKIYNYFIFLANACYKSPCQNGGTCLNVQDDYWCKCTTDYYGKIEFLMDISFFYVVFQELIVKQVNNVMYLLEFIGDFVQNFTVQINRKIIVNQIFVILVDVFLLKQLIIVNVLMIVMVNIVRSV